MASNNQVTFDAEGNWAALESEIPRNSAFDDDISTADNQILEQFEKKMDIIKAKTGRFKESYKDTLLYSIHEFAVKVGGVATTLQNDEEGVEAVNELCLWLDDQDLSPYTIESCLSSLRVFAHLMLEETPDKEFDAEELPKRFYEIDPGKHTRGLDPTPTHAELVTYEEAIEMAKQQDNPRDAAMIIVQWSAGLRPMCELYKLQYKHVMDEGDRYVITIPETAKTGSRTVHIYAGSSILRKWLEQEHPAHLDSEPNMNSETFIWTHHNKNKPIVYSTLGDVFRRAGKKAGIGKPTAPQGIRRSCASFHARQEATDERMLRKRFGWSRLSSAPRHYINHFSETKSKKTAKAQGHKIDEEETDDPVAPVRCESCKEWTVRGFDHCIWCSHPVAEEVKTISESIQHPEKKGADLTEMVISGEATADDLRGIKKLEPIIKTRKGFWDNIDKLIQLAEGYEEDDKTASVFGPTGVIAWIGDATSRTMRRWVRLQDVLLRIHPDNQYPPNRERAAKMGLSWVVMTAASLAALVTIGFGDAVLAGDPLAVGGALLALVIGVLSVHLTSLNINDIREGV